jgi:ubiquitin-conjugating enzyme E2 variant
LKVEASKIAVLAHWRRAYTLENVLVEMRKCVLVLVPPMPEADMYTREMAAPNNRKLPQPPEGSTYGTPL